jgi:hypothetical protein
LKKKLVFLTLVLSVLFFVSGCIEGPFGEFYEQISPTTYPPTQKLLVFQYKDVDLNDIYKFMFKDYLVIGRVGFEGKYYDPECAIGFGKSIGADVLLCTFQYIGTKTSTITEEIPTTETTYLNGSSSDGTHYSGTATTHGTKTATKTIITDRYKQFGVFLKNIKNVIPPWEQTIKDYEKTASNELEGVWFNNSYKLNLFQSYEQIVGFLYEDSPKNTNWKAGDLKLIFNASTGEGIYLMANRKPMTLKMELAPDKFGHLYGTLLLEDRGNIVSFQRQ